MEDFQKPIDIVSAKSKGGLFCHYQYLKDIGKDRHDTLTNKSERPMHPDLRRAFIALTPHMPVILQHIAPGSLADINSDINNYGGDEKAIEIIKKFTLTEVAFDVDNNKVTLKGTFDYELGTAPIETPAIGIDNPAYHYNMELRLGLDLLIEEIRQYDAGKQAEEPEQLDMFNPADPALTDEERSTVAPRTGRGRPKAMVTVKHQETGEIKEVAKSIIKKIISKSETSFYNEEENIYHVSALDWANLGDENTEPISEFQNSGGHIEETPSEDYVF